MSADEMTDLATTIGGDFDRLWLSMMIRHHEGAIAMANNPIARAALIAHPSDRGRSRTAPLPEVFRVASRTSEEKRTPCARSMSR